MASNWNGMSYEDAYKAATENRAKGLYNGYSPEEIDVMYGKAPAPRQLTVEEKYQSINDYRKDERDKLGSGFYDNPDNRRQWLSPNEQRLWDEQGREGLYNYFSQDAKGASPYDDWAAYWSKKDADNGMANGGTAINTPSGGGGYSYGNNWSERAKSQAAAEAQAKMDQYNQLLKKIRNQEMSAVNNMDRDYFQRYLQAAQSQTNNGLNAGIAAEQNTRLAMARQAELGDIYQDINAQNFETNNNLARVPVEQLAREHELLTQLEQMGWEREFAEKQLSQADRQFLSDLGLRRDQFDWNVATDARNFGYTMGVDNRNFEYQKSRDARRDAEWESEQKYNRWWEQYQFNNQSAAQRDASSLAWKQLEEQKRQFNSESEWRKYTYNNMSATEKRQFDEQVRQFGEEMAWNLESLRMTQEFQLGMAEAQYSGTDALASDFLK